MTKLHRPSQLLVDRRSYCLQILAFFFSLLTQDSYLIALFHDVNTDQDFPFSSELCPISVTAVGKDQINKNIGIYVL